MFHSDRIGLGDPSGRRRSGAHSFIRSRASGSRASNRFWLSQTPGSRPSAAADLAGGASPRTSRGGSGKEPAARVLTARVVAAPGAPAADFFVVVGASAFDGWPLNSRSMSVPIWLRCASRYFHWCAEIRAWCRVCGVRAGVGRRRPVVERDQDERVRIEEFAGSRKKWKSRAWRARFTR